MSEIGQINIEVQENGQPAEWPPLDEYRESKDKAIDRYKPFIQDIVRSRYYLSDLNQKEFDDAIALLSTFVFGVEMIYKRFGWKKGVVPIGFNLGGNLSSEPFGIEAYHDSPNRYYYFNVGTLEKIVTTVGKNGRLNNGEAGGIKHPTALALFELGGVEEAAHFVFLSVKKEVPAHSFMTASDELTEYHTQDIERRALVWKIQYAKRYKPEYVANLRKLEDGVSQVRMAYGGIKHE
ncbi:MAG: hypothetical protein NT162_02405 [Candidatus Woesebacteria bacterium]|nr:hypothetical protein [Candidatus Woesebacteria bacterium]